MLPKTSIAKSKSPKKVLFLVAEDSYFCSHRINLGKAAIATGFTVAVATRCKNFEAEIRDNNITVFPLQYFNRSGINPITQWLALKELLNIYRNYSPDIVHHVGMKPVLFGSMVARFCRILKIINALGGLGYLFTASETQNRLTSLKKFILRNIVTRLFYKLHQASNTSLILQNQDDINTLVNATHIPLSKIHLIRGAGVDIQTFLVTPLPKTPDNFIHIVCISRLLWDKGIGELALAAKMLQEKKLPIRVILYGMPDPENPATISLQQMQAWQDAGFIEWRGHLDSAGVAKAYADCHIAVLPSYREGLPKSLLEAASCGRAIITTDVPGCREVVQNGKNGFLVPVKNANALADAIALLSQDLDLQLKMGLEGRKLVETYFADNIIHEQTLRLYE